MKKTINRFIGDSAFLSNFFPCIVRFDGIEYPSVEHAYQAAKTLDISERIAIKHLQRASDAKRSGKHVKMRPGWDRVKLGIMHDLVEDKFSNSHLMAMLLETGDAKLEEGNDWGDTFWGTVDGSGKNHLGKILMRVREKLMNLSKLKLV